MHPNDAKDVSSNKSIHNYLEAGVKPNKIVLGVPFYGKGWSNVAATKNGLFQSGTSEHNLRLDYGKIESTLLKPGSGYVRYFDYNSTHPISTAPTPEPGWTTRTQNLSRTKRSTSAIIVSAA
jgi:chitinase